MKILGFTTFQVRNFLKPIDWIMIIPNLLGSVISTKTSTAPTHGKFLVMTSDAGLGSGLILVIYPPFIGDFQLLILTAGGYTICVYYLYNDNMCT